MILFINACVRSDSRTNKLAACLLPKLQGAVKEIRLAETAFPSADEGFIRKRDWLLLEGRYDDPMFAMARQFAEAEQIVVAAPYWDLSFPACLKQYFEQINVPGITFAYTEEGYPKGLCNAKRLFYVTTAGGNYVPEEYGFGYVKALAQGFYGINEVIQFKAAGLDIAGADPGQMMKKAVEDMEDWLLIHQAQMET